MHFYNTERVGIFIDGPSLHSTSKSLGFVIDFKRLVSLFRDRARLVRAIYYTPVLDDTEHNSLVPLIDWLSYNGFTVITKRAKEFIDQAGARRIRGRVDVQLSVGVMTLAPTLDHIVLFSGDGDFVTLVSAVQSQGKRVTVISTMQSRPPMVADELRRQADQFIDLMDLGTLICRDERVRSGDYRPEGRAAMPGRQIVDTEVTSMTEVVRRN